MATSGNGSRGSPGAEVKFHKGGIYSRHNKRDGLTYYFIRCTLPDGRRKKEKVGARKKDAQDLLEQRRTEIRLGTYIDPETRKARGCTFDQFADRFMAEYAVRCRSDHYTDRMRRLRKRFGDERLAEVTRADLDRFTAERLEKVSAATVRRDLAVLVTMFKKAVQWGVLDASPAVALDKPPEPKHKTRYLSVEECGRLQNAAAPWLRPILDLAVATGARLGELVALQWPDVDLKAGFLYVDGKTGTRPVPLTEAARAVLQRRGRVRHLKARHVFVDGTGEPYTSARARDQIRHSTPAMTQRYAHLQPDHLRGAARALDRALAGTGPNSAPNQAARDLVTVNGTGGGS